MASPNAAFTQLTAITYDNRSRKMQESITDHNAGYFMLKKKGNIKTKNGGTFITHPVLIEENTSIQNIQGAEAFDISGSPGPSAATYPWARKVMTVSETGTNIAKNSGRDAIISLVDTKIDQAMATSTNHMGVEMFGDGVTTSSIGGFKQLLTDNGVGTVANINATLYSRWANAFLEMSGTNTWQTTLGQITSEFTKLWYKTEINSYRTDTIIATNDIIQAFEDDMDKKIRYVSHDQAGKGENSFSSVFFKNVPVVRDVNANFAATGERAYFLNFNHIYLFQHPDAQWEREKNRVPVNADSVVIPFFWMGNLGMDARRVHGVLIDAA